MGYQKVLIIGNAGRDPEVRYTPSGTAVANFSVAVNEKWNNRDGELQERVTWFQVVAWNRLAEICGEYVTKGRQVFVEGRIENREWEDRDGYMFGTTHIDGAGEFQGRSFKIWFKNENHITWMDDKPYVTSPDIIEVVELESVSVPKARARELYIDHTPKPTPEELELRKMQRLSMPTPRAPGMGAPKKGERRRLRRLKEGDEP